MVVAFDGATAIVTGGASGIGRALAEGLVSRGAQVVVADIAQGSAVAGASAIELDVRDADAVRAVVESVRAQHGRLDFMFNNAGIVLGGKTHEMGVAHWQRVIDVNLMGVVNGVAAAYPVMVEQRGGHIVNTSSAAGLAGSVLVAAYSASKHAVVGLSAALRPEAARHSVRVTALCPGSVDTPILDGGPPADLPVLASPVLTGREYMAMVRLKPIPPARFAEAALRGVARNKGLVVYPASARAVWYLNRLSPSLLDRAGRVTAGRIMRDLDRRAR